MFIFPKKYDVIVIGGGHAGIEAALAASRMGCQTLLLTHNADTIGQMSCNPAIGGSAKGHLVREIDALGGEMGKTTDLTGIQFRLLNRSKGPAVQSPRAQCDKKAYQARMKWVCERQENLDLKQQQANALVFDKNSVIGVDSNLGVRFLGLTVIVTTGTFLRGLMHYGDSQILGGRNGDQVSNSLSDSLKSAGLEIRRFKTGTPPRILKKSLDLRKMTPQPGDNPIPWFSHWWSDTPKAAGDMFHVEHADLDGGLPTGKLVEKIGGQIECYLTSTTTKTREIVLSNLHLSAMYSGKIEGVGPRYCPSIEDKFVRFSDKECHQIFVEPEGVTTDEIYMNGCSSSLPFRIQLEMVRSILGCENAEILRPAYAVEYDYCPPTQLHPWLETKACENLFLAGQINGTSGYEEAASQGLIAGINAALKVKQKIPLVLRRDQSYIGVMVDDLVTKGVTEPYRMFTSRVEHRLLLRQDNADLRLSGVGFELGLIRKNLYSRVLEKEKTITNEISRLKQLKSGGVTLWKILQRPEVGYSQLPHRQPELPPDVAEQVEIIAKYEGYILRQEAEISKTASMEAKKIPPTINYHQINNLRREAAENLSKIRPITIGQASRISGITPNDIGILLTWLRGQRNDGSCGSIESVTCTA